MSRTLEPRSIVDAMNNTGALEFSVAGGSLTTFPHVGMGVVGNVSMTETAGVMEANSGFLQESVGAGRIWADYIIERMNPMKDADPCRLDMEAATFDDTIGSHPVSMKFFVGATLLVDAVTGKSAPTIIIRKRPAITMEFGTYMRSISAFQHSFEGILRLR